MYFLCQLPTIIADNAGYDSADLVAKLRAAHTEGKKTYGLGKDFVIHNLSNCEQYDSIYCIELSRTTTEQTVVNIFFFLGIISSQLESSASWLLHTQFNSDLYSLVI